MVQTLYSKACAVYQDNNTPTDTSRLVIGELFDEQESEV